MTFCYSTKYKIKTYLCKLHYYTYAFILVGFVIVVKFVMCRSFVDDNDDDDDNSSLIVAALDEVFVMPKTDTVTSIRKTISNRSANCFIYGKKIKCFFSNSINIQYFFRQSLELYVINNNLMPHFRQRDCGIHLQAVYANNNNKLYNILRRHLHFQQHQYRYLYNFRRPQHCHLTKQHRQPKHFLQKYNNKAMLTQDLTISVYVKSSTDMKQSIYYINRYFVDFWKSR